MSIGSFSINYKLKMKSPRRTVERLCSDSYSLAIRTQNLLVYILSKDFHTPRQTDSHPLAAVTHTWKALLAKPRPSCLQTTMASMVLQPSLHTVPHTREPFLSTSTSTRPSYGLRPPLRRSCGCGKKQHRTVDDHQCSWKGHIYSACCH